MRRLIPLILLPTTLSPALAQIRVPPPAPINNTIEYDHTYTPQELIEQLRDDNIRGNLLIAKGALLTHPDLTPDILYNALNHEDWQVRQVVCQTIWLYSTNQRMYLVDRGDRDHWAGGRWETIPANTDYTITEDLVRVTIEGLRDDTTPFDRPRRRGLVYFNAQFGVQRLIPIASQWRHLLDEAMDSDDAQQRFLTAYILGRAGVHESVERSAQILIPHLRDNDIREDAKFAVYGLGGFGPELLPHLKDALVAADPQQRDLIQLLMINIMDPPFTDGEREKRSSYNSITDSVHDPSSQQPVTYWSWLSTLRD